MKRIVFLLFAFISIMCSENLINEPEQIKIEKTSISNEILVWTNSPNPFTDSTMIHFYIPYEMWHLLIITDENEQVIEVLSEGFISGHQYIIWEPKIESGIYYLDRKSTRLNSSHV